VSTSDNRGQRGGRRGAHSVEFALILPAFLAVMAGILDYGWFLFLRSTSVTAVRNGCRVGAVFEQSHTPTPEDAAETYIVDHMDKFGVSCSGGGDCTVDVSITGTAPNAQLMCNIDMEFTSFTGLIPVPEAVGVTSLSFLEFQD